MGARCTGGKSDADMISYKESKAIEQKIRDGRKEAEKRVKLLLLGTGDSGKSTFVKQMKVIHKDGFSVQEVTKFQSVLQENCLQAMQRILSCDEVRVPKSLRDDKQNVLEASELKQCVASIQALWADSNIKDAFDKRSDYAIQIPSTSPYFFENVNRFAADNYQPTAEDMFRAKLKTTGIMEVSFAIGGIDFTIVDVGGQRSERRKWLHCFDDVTSVVYLAALDEYDHMKLEEDNETSRLAESLRLFGEVTASTFFTPASWILFLNKSDLFLEKIKRKPLSKYFPDFAEADDSDSTKCCDFIRKKYEAVFRGSKLYPYVTCAIDTENCRRVFTAVRDSVITNALVNAGF
jgi:GTPase SAR1 family protein